MSGYRGDGYGEHGNVGDEDFRWGDGRREGGRDDHGAARGNLMGRAEERVRGFFDRDDDHDDRESRRLSDDPRAVRAADEYRRRYGREGYEGSYGLHDESYRQYRDRHLASLDDDYADYCREHGHEFSSQFESWRQGRRQGGAVPAMAEGGGSPQAGSASAGALGASNESPNLLVDESSGVAIGDDLPREGAQPPRSRKR